jgi:tRNA (cmo5U34)-methyltransferase
MNNKTGWQTNEAARHYECIGNFMIPGRDEIMEIVSGLTAAFTPLNGFILDLGCGYGDATYAALLKVPDSSAVLIDFSDEMLRRARERFRSNQKIKLIKYNLNEGIPNNLKPASFDAVISCFALHHIDFERRIPLYIEINNVLKPGGIFVNGDRFVEESPAINEWMFDIWVRWMTNRVKERFEISKSFDQMKARQIERDRDLGDKPGSLWSMGSDLRMAGFTYIDCLYKNQIVSVVAAIK